MKLEGSLPSLQQPASKPFPESENNAYFPTPYTLDSF